MAGLTRDGGAASGQLLVLIVEDNEKNLKLVRDVLAFRGILSVEARTATDGIRLAAEHQPDVVLMDIHLPDMDGIAALERLRNNSATAAIPVVAVTAYAMKGDAERLVGAGFNAYIAKPIEVRTFVDELRAVLSSKPDSPQPDGNGEHR